MRWNDYVNTYANKTYPAPTKKELEDMEKMVKEILNQPLMTKPAGWEYTDHSDHTTSYFGPPNNDEIAQSHIKHLNSQMSSMRADYESKIRTLTKQVSELTDTLKELKDSYDVLMDEVSKLIKASR